jgi:hypothetical protein
VVPYIENSGIKERVTAMAKKDSILMLAPVHLKRKAGIADRFGVCAETVTQWAKEGAPIFLVGNKYQADYHSLVAWLSRNRPAFKKLSSPPPATV